MWVDPFVIDKYEVTQAQFAQLQISDPSEFRGDRLPVERQTWIDAVRFCTERSLAENLEPCYDEGTLECDFSANGYRLPTEAEREYAARAGSSGAHPWGDDGRRDGNGRLPVRATAAFYGWWNPHYLVLIAWSTTVDFLAARAMAGSPRRRLWLSVNVANNLALLGFFKYGALVTDNVNLLLSRTGIDSAVPGPGVLLPVGISFTCSSR